MIQVEEQESSGDLLPGTLVGDHLVVRSVLGRGGTAVVYEAVHTRLSALVALKVLDVPAAYREDAARRLQREAEVCASLDDPHVPRIHDVGALPDGTPYVVMEKVLGTTLEQLLAQGRLRLPVVLAVGDDLMAALEAVHRAGVVHRDIKPANLIIKFGQDGSAHVRLMDFGISKSACRESSDPKLTRVGTVVGTPHYMAPEQITGDSVDARADIYATGVVLFEMLTGRTPYQGETTAEIVGAVLRHDERAFASAFGPDVPVRVQRLVLRAMAAKPSERFATIHEMRLALADTLLPEPELDLESGFARVAQRRYWPLWGAGVLAVSTVAWPASVGRESPPRPADGSHPVSSFSELPSLPNLGRLELHWPEAKPTEAPSAEPAPAPRLSRALPSEPGTLATPTKDRAERPAPRKITAPEPVESGVLLTDYLQQLNTLQREVTEASVEARGAAREQNNEEEPEERAIEAPRNLDRGEGTVPENPY